MIVRGTAGNEPLFRPWRGLAPIVVLLLAAYALAALPLMGVFLVSLGLVRSIQAYVAWADGAGASAEGARILIDGAKGAITLSAPLSLALFMLGIPAAVAFLTWLLKVRRGLPALGAEPRYSAGWTVGAWLIPGVQLVAPYLVMRDLWRGCGAGPAALLGLFWALFATGLALTYAYLGWLAPLLTLGEAWLSYDVGAFFALATTAAALHVAAPIAGIAVVLRIERFLRLAPAVEPGVGHR